MNQSATESNRQPLVSVVLRWCVYVFVATVALPVSVRLQSSPEVYKVAYALSAGTALLTAASLAWPERSWRVGVPALALPMGLLLAWATLSALWSTNPFYALELVEVYVAGGLAFVLVFAVSRDATHARQLLGCLFWSGVALSLLALAQHRFGVDWVLQGPARPAATFGNKNFLMHFLVMTTPLGIALLVSARSRVNIVALAAGLALVCSVYLVTLNRAALLAAVVQAGVFVLLARRQTGPGGPQPRRRAVVVLAAIVLGVLLGLNLGGGAGALSDRIGSGGEELARLVAQDAGDDAAASAIGSVRQRMQLWSATLAMLADHGLVGVGAGNWRVYYPLYTAADRDPRDLFSALHPHNSWLGLTADLGVVGLLLAVWLATMVLRRVLHRPTATDTPALPVFAMGLGLLGILVVSMFSSPFERVTPVVLIASLLALMARAPDEPTLRNVPLPGLPGTRRWLLATVLAALTLGSSWLGLARVREEVLVVQASERVLVSADWFGASDLSRRALQANPLSRRGLAFAGFGAAMRGREENAATYLAHFLKTEPYNFGTLVFYADLLAGLGRDEQALDVARLCLRMDPDHEAMLELEAKLNARLAGGT